MSDDKFMDVFFRVMSWVVALALMSVLIPVLVISIVSVWSLMFYVVAGGVP